MESLHLLNRRSYSLETFVDGFAVLNKNHKIPSVPKDSKRNRIVECFGLEGTFRGQLAQPPCSEQGHLQLDQVAQSPIQPGFECFQEWGLHYLSGQPVPVFHHPYGKKFLPYI